MAQSDKKRRRRQRQFKTKMARKFMENLVHQADLWESKGLTAEEIIADMRRQGREAGILLNRMI